MNIRFAIAFFFSPAFSAAYSSFISVLKKNGKSTIKQFTILIVQAGFCIVCFSQASQVDRLKIDSLKKVLPSLRDSARIDCLNAIFRYWMFNDSFKYYVAMAYEGAIKINYVPGIAEAVNDKAVTEMLSGNYSNAEKLARESLLWYGRTSNKTNIAATFLTLGSALKSQSSFLEAMSYLEKAYEYGKKAGDEVEMFLALEHLAFSSMEIGDYEKAFDRYRESLQLTFKIDNEYWIVILLEHLGQLYRDIEDYNTALAYFRQAYQRIKAKPGFDYYGFAELFSLKQQFDSAKYYYSFVDTTKHTDARLLVSLSEYYFLQKQYDKALNNALRALPYLRNVNDRNQLMRALLNIAKIYSAIGNYNAGFLYAKEGLTMAHQTGARHLIMDGYQILYSVYDHWRKTDSAFFYYRKYVGMKDSILTDQIKGKLVAYGYEQKIELLNKEKEIQQVNLQKEALFKDILIAGILILLLLGIFIFRNIMLKRKNEKNQREIAENELQIQKLQSERTRAELQQQATELEMQALRAQMNPHFIFNSLNSINRFILQNNKAQASEYLTKFSKLVRFILQNSQAALITLETELESLQLYLELEALRFDHHFEYKISVDDDLETDVIKVPPLIIQPYAENAIWHGLMHKEETGHLEIRLYQQDDLLCCRITDDGIGRKNAAALKSKSASTHKSMGMRITAERIAKLQQKNKMDTCIQVTDLMLPDGSAGGTEVLLKILFVQ
jgi:tetratricopeptide (TPR) repeat protein